MRVLRTSDTATWWRALLHKKQHSTCIVSILLINNNLFSCNRTIFSLCYFKCFLCFFRFSIFSLFLTSQKHDFFIRFTSKIMLKSNTIVLYITSRPWETQTSHQKQWFLINISTSLKIYTTCLTKKVEKYVFSKNMTFSKLFGDHLGIIWGTFRGLLGVL